MAKNEEWHEWLKRGRWVCVALRGVPGGGHGMLNRIGRVLGFDSYGVQLRALIINNNCAQVTDMLIPWESIIYIENYPEPPLHPLDASAMRIDEGD